MKHDPSLTPTRRGYLRRIRAHDRLIRGLRWLLLLALLALWELAARMQWIDPFVTSCPSRVAETVVRLVENGELWLHIGVTLYETVAGFLIGTLLGTLLASFLWWSDIACRVLDPYLVVLNALPKIALGPILIVWIGSGTASIIVMAVLISLIVTTVTVLTGFLETTHDKQLLMRTLGATKLTTFRLIVLPAGLPAIVAALKMSVSMSWVGVIVGEYLVSQAGLGFLIVYGGQVFKLDLVMASIVILCLLAALMYYAIAYLEKHLVKA